MDRSPLVTNHNISILKDSNNLRLKTEEVWWQWLYALCFEFGGFCSGVAKESILLGYDAASMGSLVMTFWFNVVSSSRLKCPGIFLFWHFNLWRWHHAESKHHDPLTQWHCVMSQKNRILSYTAVKTPKLSRKMWVECRRLCQMAETTASELEFQSLVVILSSLRIQECFASASISYQ